MAVLPANIEQSVGSLVTLIQIFLGVVGAYFIFWIINLIVSSRRIKLMREILENIKQINKKLDRLKR